MSKITMEELKGALSQYTGSESFYSGKPLFPKFVHTEGIKLMADKVGAYWLIDLVYSHQRDKVKDAPFQIWKLTVKDKGAVIECREDSDTPVIARQEIAYTDFPEGEFEVWFINHTLLLPSEY